jgi:hypothetical protein
MNSSAPKITGPEQCPLCGKPNDCLLCSPVVYKGQCWCTHEEIPTELLARVPDEFRNRACICRSCIEKFRLVKNLLASHPTHATRHAPG